MSETKLVIANRIMRIDEAYSSATGTIISGIGDSSSKLRCPFTGMYHDDYRSFRIYPQSNSAYCFACKEYFTPVKLISMTKGLSLEEATDYVLELKGYREKTFEEKWDELDTQELRIDTSYLAEALKVFCSRAIPSWSTEQFNPSLSRKLTQCLNLLPAVRSEADSERWLSASQEAMLAVAQREKLLYTKDMDKNYVKPPHL